MKLVITGGSGLLAINWAYKMRDYADICLFTHKHDVNIKNVERRKVNLGDIDNISQAISDFNADIIIHTAGMTNVDECERNPTEAYYANATLAQHVAITANNLNKKLVHISTDHLFDGSKTHVSEDEPPQPLNIYGKSKLEAEKLVQTTHPEALIVRTNFYGWGHSERSSLSDWIINSLQQGKIVTAFHNAFFSPILIDHMAEVIHELVALNMKGIINVCGDQKISKYDFAQSIAKVFKLDATLIQKTSIEEAKLFAKRPKDMSLNNKKAMEVLGKSFGNLKSGLAELYKHRNRKDVFEHAIS